MGQIQDAIKGTLAKAGIPYKQIECYGNQIVVTAWSQDAADRWTLLLASFARVRGQTKSLDEKAGAKPNSSPSQKYVPVVRVFAVVAS